MEIQQVDEHFQQSFNGYSNTSANNYTSAENLKENLAKEIENMEKLITAAFGQVNNHTIVTTANYIVAATPLVLTQGKRRFSLLLPHMFTFV